MTYVYHLHDLAAPVAESEGIMSTDFKTCNVCLQDRPLRDFNRYGPKRPQLRSLCKICEKKRKRAYYGSDIGRMAMKIYRQTNGRYSNAKTLAKRHNKDFTLTRSEYMTLINTDECKYCNMSLPMQGIALDRLNNLRGYSIDNVVPCCTECNKARADYFTPDEMVLIGKAIATVKTARKISCEVRHVAI